MIPFIAIATARNTGWTIEMHLSRGAVFHSTALLVSGVFLLAVAGAGYIVRYFGGDWGRALQIELLFAAVVFGALVATSGRFRSRLKVFVSKHFFSYRYDYREEWLRFTRTLSTDSGALRSGERAIQALADLVESPAGALWLADEREGFRPAARLNMPPVDAVAADATRRLPRSSREPAGSSRSPSSPRIRIAIRSSGTARVAAGASERMARRSRCRPARSSSASSCCSIRARRWRSTGKCAIC